MKKYKIGVYLRISVEDQDIGQSGKQESYSIANQRTLIHDFIRQKPEFAGADVLEFCDDGWSGKNFERPAVKNLLEQVKRGGIQCIIVKDLSRFGRDYLTVGNFLSRVFPALGVRLIAVNDGVDSLRTADIDSLETTFKTLLYDLYSRDLSVKVRSAKKFRAKQGAFLSPFAPYGYRKAEENKNRLVIDPQAAEVVRRIYQMTAQGIRPEEIARTFNAEEVPTPMQYKRAMGCPRQEWPNIEKDNFWTDGTIVKILRDERYTGKNIYGKRTRDEVGKSHVVRVERADWIVTENTHEPIVSQEEFESVQMQLRAHSGRDLRPGRKGNIFYKKVRCGVCGHMMRRVYTKHPYYICSTPRVTDAYPCMSEKISECDLLEIVLTALRTQVACAVDISSLWEEQQRKAQKKMIDLRAFGSRIENEMQTLYEKFALGELDKAGYLAAKSTVIKKRDAVTSKINELEAMLKDSSADDSAQEAVLKVLTAKIAAGVLEGIVIYPENKLQVFWNYQEI